MKGDNGRVYVSLSWAKRRGAQAQHMTAGKRATRHLDAGNSCTEHCKPTKCNTVQQNKLWDNVCAPCIRIVIIAIA